MLSEPSSTVPADTTPVSASSPTPFSFSSRSFSEGRLRVLSFHGREAVSRPFRFDVTLAAHPGDDVEARLFGERATLAMSTIGGDERAVHGIVAAVEALGAFDHARIAYRVRLVPRLRLLGERKTSRIFQEKTVPEIVGAVLDAARVPHRAALVEKHARRLYCVQYQETDLAFLTRLLAEEGIFYFLDHGHEDTVVLADSAHLYDQIASDPELTYRCNEGSVGLVPREHDVFRFSLRRALRPGTVLHRDYDFRRPRLDLRGETKPPSSPPAASAPGATPFEASQLCVYDHHGEDERPEADAHTARVRLEQRRGRAVVARGASASRRLVPGYCFTLAEHDVGALDGRYVLASVAHEGRAPEITRGRERIYANTFECVPADVALRPERPERALQQVTETAVVVGPKGEEIYTDAHGRVKVQFPWDLDGKKDEHSSCWVRVAQAWAGAGWGFQFIPRIGMEVVVTFVGGDTDRPLVTGCVPNAANVPPFKLPEDRTRSGIKTRTTPGGHGSNELSFEDRKGAELIILRAELDLEERVSRNRTTAVGHNDRLTVGANLEERVGQDHATTVLGNRRETVQGDATASSAGGRAVSVGKNDVRHVAGDDLALVTGSAVRQVTGTLAEHVGQGYVLAVKQHYDLQVGTHDAPKHGTVYASGNYRVIAGQEAIVRAEKSLTLACGASAITLTPDGITIHAPKVTVEGGAVSIKGKGPEIRVSDKAEILGDRIHLQAKEAVLDLEHDATMDGRLVKLNCGPERVKPDGDGAPEPTHAVIHVLQHIAGTPCERMKVTVANAKGETRDYLTGPDGTIHVDFAPEEKGSAIRVVAMAHADAPDRAVHLTGAARS